MLIREVTPEVNTEVRDCGASAEVSVRSFALEKERILRVRERRSETVLVVSGWLAELVATRSVADGEGVCTCRTH